MKIAVRIALILVGVLFVVSGLVKANDPVGLAYKMQEFFELWNADLSAGSFFLKKPLIALFSWMHDHALLWSVAMITLEIVAGVALLLGWKKHFILWLLLLLIIFFTFLTGYAYLSGKFTNCGCFGDCLPITPFASFLKDLALLALIVFLLLGRKHIRPLLSSRGRVAVLVTTLALSLGLQWYVLSYLPLADCLPLKQGNHIPDQLKPPPGAVTDSFSIRFIYEKGGKRYEFEQLPEDYQTYTYVDRIDKLVRKGNAEAPLKGFALFDSTGADHTSEVLQAPAAVLVFAQHFSQPSWVDDIEALAAAAAGRGVPVYFAAPSGESARKVFSPAAPIRFFSCDFTVVRTAARTEPTIYYLQKGTIVRKYSGRETGSARKRFQ